MATRIVVTVLRKIPFLSGLPDCTIDDHRDASKQIGWILLGSTLPIWLGTLVVLFMKDNQTSNIASAFFSNIQGGELFLYCTSALAPVFYMALYERPGVGGFPNRSGHIAVVVILMIVCGAVFSLIKGDVDLHQEGIIYLSLWLYPISVLLLYLATVYHSARHPKNPAEKMRSQEEDFLKHFNDRHSGKG